MLSRDARFLPAGLLLIFFIWLVGGILLRSIPTGDTPSPSMPPPPPMRVYTPSEATVDISTYSSDQTYDGKGLVILQNGQKIVVTSTMLFSADIDSVTVETIEAKVLYRDDELGLIALECDLVSPYIELTDDPNVSTFVIVAIDDKSSVATLDFISDDWILLGCLPEGDCTGYPVSQGGKIVGLVIGINRIDLEQAIMVCNQGLREFCDRVGDTDGI